MTDLKRAGEHTHSRLDTHTYSTTNSLSLENMTREYSVNDCSVGYRLVFLYLFYICTIIIRKSKWPYE